MPEYRVSIGNRNTPEINFSLLNEEKIEDHRLAHTAASTSNSFIKSSIQAGHIHGKTESIRQQAVSVLSQVIPQDVAAGLVQAAVERRIGSNVVFKKGEQGYVVIESNTV